MIRNFYCNIGHEFRADTMANAVGCPLCKKNGRSTNAYVSNKQQESAPSRNTVEENTTTPIEIYGWSSARILEANEPSSYSRPSEPDSCRNDSYSNDSSSSDD